MIDALTEKLLALNAARRFFPRRRRNKRPDLATMYRWTRTGCRGVVLESVRVGGTRCTTREAMARFVGRLTQLNTPETVASSPSTRNRTTTIAESELDRIGI